MEQKDKYGLMSLKAKNYIEKQMHPLYECNLG